MIGIEQVIHRRTDVKPLHTTIGVCQNHERVLRLLAGVNKPINRVGIERGSKQKVQRNNN